VRTLGKWTFKIIVVDDYADAADALAVLLTLSGHTVRIAATAADAVNLFDNFLPDVCFIEIATPDMDGCALARSLHASRRVVVSCCGFG
jgi:DNA-binding response OmpR family regulator